MTAWLLTLMLGVTPAEIIDTAQSYLGVPYRYGARDGRGVDCSGFVQQVFAAHGIALPRTSRDQASVGEAIDWDEATAGDLLFFSESPSGGRVNHVGIAIGDGRMIHASTGRGEVVIDDLQLRYYKDRRARARRVLGLDGSTPSLLSAASSDEDTEPASSLAPSITPASPAALTAASAHAVVRLAPTRTAIGLRGGAARHGDAQRWLAAAYLSVRAEELDLEAQLQAPWVFADGAPLWRFERAADYLRVLETLRLGRPDSRLYLEASRDLSLTLGQRALVSSSTPASAHRGHVGLPTHAGFAVTSRIVGRGLDAQLVLDDVLVPRVAGARLGSDGRVALALEAAADPRARRGGAALEGRARLLERERITWGADLTLAAVDTRRAQGGVLAGSWLTYRGQSLELGARAAAFARQPGYAPGLFDAAYRAAPSRWGAMDEVSADRHERWGWELAASAAYTRRVTALARYRHDAPLGAAGRYVPARELELQLALRDLYFASAGSYVSCYATYLRPLELPERELFFAGARLRVSDVVSLGAQLAKRPESARHPASMSGFVDVTVELGL